MSTTDVDLYRSVRMEQFPNGVFNGDGPAPGVLFPDFYDRAIGNGSTRAADVKIEHDAGIEYVLSGGGTSLFDRAGIFKRDGWLSFQIPAETVIPDSLVINKGGWHKQFKATHYQIESRARRMTKLSMEGALDNLARNAIVRLVQLGRASLKVE